MADGLARDGRSAARRAGFRSQSRGDPAVFVDVTNLLAGSYRPSAGTCLAIFAGARPRRYRGGNVWQHLRSFRKRLFDAIPDDALRLDGEYVDLANDWAFMLPIVEMARNPVHVTEALYLYEPSGVGKDVAGRAAREETVARLVAKGPVTATDQPGRIAAEQGTESDTGNRR